MERVSELSQFLHPHSRYYGQVKPENLVFNANLQEFAQRVSLIAGLQSNGKMTPEESFKELEELWRQLEQSKDALGIGQNLFQAD